MSDADGQSRAERYREIALSLARLAARTHYHEARQQLFTLAEQFERMAEFAEKWEDIEE
jgi:hypothetical protein